jgi:hypothetical protein
LTPEQVQTLCDAIDEGGRMLVAVFLAIGGVVTAGVLIGLFLCLLGGKMWRFLTVGRWNSVVVSAERKAFK